MYWSPYPSISSSSSCPMAQLNPSGKLMILLKDRLSCRSDGQLTLGSRVTSGPTQFLETLSALSDSRDSSSTGSDCSWLPCRSSRVRFLRFYGRSTRRSMSWSSLDRSAAPCRWATWQRAEGNSSRQLWLRSRRSRCPSCCWTKPLSIKQDRESSSLPDRSSKRIFSLSLAGGAELSPQPKTEEEGRPVSHQRAVHAAVCILHSSYCIDLFNENKSCIQYFYFIYSWCVYWFV